MYNSELIKEALTYDLASDIHEDWRRTRLLADGTYENRIKKTKDEEWISKYSTDDVDIANCSFDKLPKDWQYENLESSKVVINLVFDRINRGLKINKKEKEEIASIIHDEWLRRNEWVYDINYGNPKLAVPYDHLTDEDKKKDLFLIDFAIKKVLDYKRGLIDIYSICNTYNLVDSL